MPILNLHSSQSRASWTNYGAWEADTYLFLLSPFLHKPPERDGIERSCHEHPHLHSWTNKVFDLPSIYTWQPTEVCNFPQAILILINSFCQIHDIHMETT